MIAIRWLAPDSRSSISRSRDIVSIICCERDCELQTDCELPTRCEMRADHEFTSNLAVGSQLAVSSELAVSSYFAIRLCDNLSPQKTQWKGHTPCPTSI